MHPLGPPRPTPDRGRLQRFIDGLADDSIPLLLRHRPEPFYPFLDDRTCVEGLSITGRSFILGSFLTDYAETRISRRQVNGERRQSAGPNRSTLRCAYRSVREDLDGIVRGS